MRHKKTEWISSWYSRSRWSELHVASTTSRKITFKFKLWWWLINMYRIRIPSKFQEPFTSLSHKILVTYCYKLLTQKFVTKIVNEKSGSNGGLHFLTFLIGGVAFAGGYYAFQKYRRRLIPTPTQYIGKNHSSQIWSTFFDQSKSIFRWRQSESR